MSKQESGFAHPDQGRTETARIPDFDTADDWAAIEEAVRDGGGAVVHGVVSRELVDLLNSQVDAWLERSPAPTSPATGSPLYDRFLGRRTLRMHGLPLKISASHELITHPQILGSMSRMLSAWSSSILLSAAELIQIGPGESSQVLHRDTGSWWPGLPRTEHPWNVSAMVALSPFTPSNGGTRVVPGSCQWPLKRRPRAREIAQAVMSPGDILLFRGDVLHGGGANRTVDAARRGLTLSYCAGWLRPVDNCLLGLSADRAREMSDELLALLGWAVHDSTDIHGGVVGTYDYKDPLQVLRGEDAAPRSQGNNSSYSSESMESTDVKYMGDGSSST
ncbi:phytanoyl-CoA dioxygenase family protein [Streptomyces coelicoflavus]|uniref:phytanoyl-CoA dioxygenase family protein n=1 Tax=Streptomyces coelicoflavus TaxID=285562 RepID=UPI0036B39A3C